MRREYWGGLLLMVLLTWGAAVPAEEAVILEDVRVEAKREASAERNAVVIDIRSEAPAVAASVPDILDQTSGIDIQKRSILTPKNSQVKIRGLDERRSLIMLDGRPLNGTGVMGGQFVDWSALSVDGWQTVDVGKGAFSAKYGNTLGGTINLIPEAPAEAPAARINMGYKRYDTYAIDASVSAKTGALGGRFAAGYIDTDGHLRNSQAERTNVAGNLFYDWGDNGRISAAIRYTDGEYGMPVENQSGSAGYDPDYPESLAAMLIGPGIRFPTGDTFGDGSFYIKQRTELDLGVSRTVAGFGSELKVYFNTEEREDVFYSYDDGDTVLKRECEPDRSWGWVGRFEKTVADHRIGFGADGNYQGYGGTDITYVREGYFPSAPSEGSDDWDGTRWHGAYVDDAWTVFDTLSLYAGLRYEDYYGDRTVDQVTGYAGGMTTETIDATLDEEVLLPKAGLVYRPVQGVSLFGRVARATRFPDNPAFYWYYGGYRPEVDPTTDVVRKDLTYEDALQYEAGITYAPSSRLTATLSYYAYEVDDYIRWIFGYRPSRVVYNIDEVTFNGVELDVEGRIWNNVTGFFNFTWQETEKSGDVLDASNALSDSLSELPEYKFNAGLKYRRADGMEARASVRWVDDREVPYLDGEGAPDGAAIGSTVTLKNLDDYAVVNLSVRYPLWKRRSTGFLTTGVENLFDERYEEAYGYPSMGQTFYIGLEIKI